MRSPVGWANNIIKDINAGGLCEYLNEYRRGEPLGMCEKQEWEIAPGQVYPRFLRFLNCRLKTNQMSGEQSIAAVHKALRDKGEAMELWESFKRGLWSILLTSGNGIRLWVCRVRMFLLSCFLMQK